MGDTAEPQKNWFARHKTLTAILGFIVLVIVLSVATGGGDETDDTGEPAAREPAARDTEEQATPIAEDRLYLDRVDAQPEDQERAIGQSATINGVAATITAADFRQQVSDFERDGYIVVQIALVNEADETRPYNVFNWRIQTPDGQVQDVDFTTMEGQLDSGDLVTGGRVAGSAVWKVGETRGAFYILWKPDAFDAARGVWQVTI